ncbi:MAG: glycosyltransferase [Candidatus Electryoneaceae bacterium]|nr:glycosyltransferase [Candidatus Electryoneaceae bacterium]
MTDPIVPARRVALAHDWLTVMRGGEMVLEELCHLFPDADLFTIIHSPGTVSPLIESRRIIESPIVKLPGGRRLFRSYLPLFPWAVEAFDLRGYDLIISSSHCAIKGLIPPPNALHMSYVHTPMRYVWDMRTDYVGPQKIGPIARAVAGLVAHYLRNWDVVASTRVDHLIANSNHVRRRIWKYYRRRSSVIFPPVSVEHFSIAKSATKDYFLVVSALVPYKRVDLAVDVCRRLDVRLIVVGEGPERGRLKRMAGKRTEFIGWQSQDVLTELYQNAIALLFPGEEDFGIVPVEAQACGTPVIAYGYGGALDTVIADPSQGENRTGLFFHEQTQEALIDAIRELETGTFNPEAIRRHAMRFSRGRFRREISSQIAQAWKDSRE